MSRFICTGLLALGLLGGFTVHRLTAQENEEKPEKQEESAADKQFDQLMTQFNEFGRSVQEALLPAGSEKPLEDAAAQKVYQQKLAAKVKQLLAEVEKMASNEEASTRQRQTAEQMKMRLVQLGSQYDAQFAKQIVEGNPGTDFAAMAEAQGFLQQMKAGAKPKDLKVGLQGYAGRYPNSAFPIQVYTVFAQFLESNGNTEDAIEVCEAALEQFPDSPFSQQLQATLKNLRMVGQDIELTGPTLEGSQFNIDSLQGKVVLVDFWATWCGPCIASLPGVHRIYEKYHEKGFEIVGVSLDNDKDELKNFIKEHEMPWTQIIFDEPEKMGWNNPLADKFGVTGIPRMILVGRDGKVVASSIRGEEDIEAAVQRELAKSAKPLAN